MLLVELDPLSTASPSIKQIDLYQGILGQSPLFLEVLRRARQLCIPGNSAGWSFAVLHGRQAARASASRRSWRIAWLRSPGVVVPETRSAHRSRRRAASASAKAGVRLRRYQGR